MSVKPIPLDAGDPLARAAGIENILEVTVADAGVFRISGPGAGGRVTAGAVYADLGRLVAGERPVLFGAPVGVQPGLKAFAVNRAPAGSAMTVPRTGGTSNGSTRTWPPCSRAVAATRSASATANVTFQCGASPLARGMIQATHSLKPGGAPKSAWRLADAGIELLEEVRVARQANHRAVHGAHVDLVDLPAEDLAVEPSGTGDVGGLELAEIPRARCVHRLGSGDVARLPEAEGWRRSDRRTTPSG